MDKTSNKKVKKTKKKEDIVRFIRKRYGQLIFHDEKLDPDDEDEKVLIPGVTLTAEQKNYLIYMIVDATFDYILDMLRQGEEIFVGHFGKFSRKVYAGRTIYHPETKEPITLPPSYRINFMPLERLRKEFSEIPLDEDDLKES